VRPVEKPLDGGHIDALVRLGDTIERPRNPASDAVQAFARAPP
jgi:hypothetical protein